MPNRAIAVLLTLAFACLVISCGGASSEEPSSAEAEDEGQTMLSGADVCALVSEDAVAGTLGVEAVTSEPSSTGTPHCSFTQPGGPTGTNVVLSVLRRDEDLGGSQGGAAFQRALDLNRVLLPGSSEVEIGDLGSSALFLENEGSNLLIVQVGPRVMTVAGQGLTAEVATGIAAAAIENL